ncbi:MAG: UDP-N-acetylenolpyruvoylglucosamine reductase, partial [Limnobacter sp.]|nr:UDP-N-acetylenolpyruvoylglucosamine reductase [Limnobacter sp.]
MCATHCLPDVNLQPLHTFGLPCVASRVCVLRNHADIAALVHSTRTGQQPLLLGEGSNTVFLAPTYEGTVWQVALKG